MRLGDSLSETWGQSEWDLETVRVRLGGMLSKTWGTEKVRLYGSLSET